MVYDYLDISDYGRKILSVLDNDVEKSIKQIADETKLPVQTIYNHCNKLFKNGYIRQYIKFDKKANKPITFVKLFLHKDYSEYVEKINKLPKIKRSYKNKGVYLLYDSDEELIYIGQSADIRQRLSQHNNKSWVYYKVIEVKNYLQRLKIEEYLINKFKPEYNLSNNSNYQNGSKKRG